MLGPDNNSLIVLGSLSNFAARTTPMRHSTLHTVSTTKTKVSAYNYSTASSPLQQGRELGYSVPPSPTGSDNISMETSSLRVCAIIHREEDGYCVRTNNLPAYLEANRHVSSPRTRIFILIHRHMYSLSTIHLIPYPLTRRNEPSSIQKHQSHLIRRSVISPKSMRRRLSRNLSSESIALLGRWRKSLVACCLTTAWSQTGEFETRCFHSTR